MNEEEKKAINNMKIFARVHQDMTDVTAEEMNIALKLIEKLQKENEKLKNIRYDTPYGTETIHLIPESDLIEINTQKYMIEVEPGKFVDLKQVYQENKKLNEYKENYIPVQKVKDKIEWLSENILNNDHASDSDKDIAEYQVNVLQGLLEKRK